MVAKYHTDRRGPHTCRPQKTVIISKAGFFSFFTKHSIRKIIQKRHGSLSLLVVSLGKHPGQTFDGLATLGTRYPGWWLSRHGPCAGHAVAQMQTRQGNANGSPVLTNDARRRAGWFVVLFFLGRGALDGGVMWRVGLAGRESGSSGACNTCRKRRVGATVTVVVVVGNGQRTVSSR